jgi:GTPase SAR1 family protein
VLFLYDVTSAESFEYLSEVLEVFKKSRTRKGCLVFVVGNKIDEESERKVELAQVKELFSDTQAEIFEVSVKENLGCDDMFTVLEETVFP